MLIKVRLQGHEFDLLTLAELFREGDPAVATDHEGYFLSFTAPDGLLDDGARLSYAASVLLCRANGAARTLSSDLRPVGLTGRFSDETGRQHQVVLADTAEARARANPVMVSVGGEQPPPPPAPGPGYVQLAQTYPDVAEVLDILGNADPAPDWSDLYQRVAQRLQLMVDGALLATARATRRAELAAAAGALLAYHLGGRQTDDALLGEIQAAWQAVAGGTSRSDAQPTPIWRRRSSPERKAAATTTSRGSSRRGHAARRSTLARRARVDATASDVSAISVSSTSDIVPTLGDRSEGRALRPAATEARAAQARRLPLPAPALPKPAARLRGPRPAARARASSARAGVTDLAWLRARASCCPWRWRRVCRQRVRRPRHHRLPRQAPPRHLSH